GLYVQFVPQRPHAQLEPTSHTAWLAEPSVTQHQGTERVLAVRVEVQKLLAMMNAGTIVARGERDVRQACLGEEVLVFEAFSAENCPVVERLGQEVTLVQLACPLVEGNRFVGAASSVESAGERAAVLEILDVQPHVRGNQLIARFVGLDRERPDARLA